MKDWVGTIFVAIALVVGALSAVINRSELKEWKHAAVPATTLVGADTLEGLMRALNPCIVDGPLPEGCEQFVKNGVVTQPPIKIVIDLEKVAAMEENKR